MEEHSREFEIIQLIKVTLSAVSLTVESFGRTRFAAEWLRLLTDTFWVFFFLSLFEHRPNPMCYFGARLNCLACHSALVAPEENRLEKKKKKKGQKNVWGSPFNVVQQKDHPQRSAELMEGS